jgi:hypothetical protein
VTSGRENESLAGDLFISHYKTRYYVPGIEGTGKAHQSNSWSRSSFLPPTTSGDYHRIVPPTLIVPTDVTQPIPVGLLSCQRRSGAPTFSLITRDWGFALHGTLGDPPLCRLEAPVVGAFLLQADVPHNPPRRGAKVPIRKVSFCDSSSVTPSSFLEVVVSLRILYTSGAAFEVFGAKCVAGHAVYSIGFPTLGEL